MGGDQGPEPCGKEPSARDEGTHQAVRGIKLGWDTPCLERVFKRFEKNNNVSLLVFGHEAAMNNTYIIPLHVPTERRREGCSPVLFEGLGRGWDSESLLRSERHVASREFLGQQEEGKEIRV